MSRIQNCNTRADIISILLTAIGSLYILIEVWKGIWFSSSKQPKVYALFNVLKGSQCMKQIFNLGGKRVLLTGISSSEEAKFEGLLITNDNVYGVYYWTALPTSNGFHITYKTVSERDIKTIYTTATYNLGLEVAANH